MKAIFAMKMPHGEQADIFFFVCIGCGIAIIVSHFYFRR
jgi:hypothetical protein